MLCGVGVALLHAEDARTIRLRSREGLVEQRAKQLPWPAASPQRTRYTAPTYPAGLAAGVGVVTLQVTTAADGQVVEARAYEVTLRGPVEARADEATAASFAAAAVSAANGWAYEPSRHGPLTFLANVVVRSDGTPGSQAAPGPVPRLEHGDARVKATKRVAATFPAIARVQRIQGVIVLEAAVGRDGRVTDSRVLRAIPHLDRAALDAVARWEFEPQALFGSGSDESVTIELLLNFALP
jgi:TonB family protein